MKDNIHPHYRTVVFHDTSANEYFMVGSTIKTDREIERDGVVYPYVTIEVSSASHPYYTGKQKPLRRKEAQHASSSVLVDFLKIKRRSYAGVKFIKKRETASSGLPGRQT